MTPSLAPSLAASFWLPRWLPSPACVEHGAQQHTHTQIPNPQLSSPACVLHPLLPLAPPTTQPPLLQAPSLVVASMYVLVKSQPRTQVDRSEASKLCANSCEGGCCSLFRKRLAATCPWEHEKLHPREMDTRCKMWPAFRIPLFAA